MSRETLENGSLQGKCPCDCSITEALAHLFQLKELVKIADRKKVTEKNSDHLKNLYLVQPCRRESPYMSGEWTEAVTA